MSESYIMVFTVRYVFTPAWLQVAIIVRRSSIEKLALERERMFSPCTPKYIASAPALIAACRDSKLPTGAIISKSERVMCGGVWFLCCVCKVIKCF